MKQVFALGGLLAAASCGAPSTPATAPAAGPVQQAVATYIKGNAAAFAGYEPVRWSQPRAYTKMEEAASKGLVAMQVFDEALVPRNKALAAYKASLARHDAPAKTAEIMARYGKANKYNDSLLVIANKFGGVKDTARLGTAIVHAYRTKNEAGAAVLDSATFVVYPGGKVEQL